MSATDTGKVSAWTEPATGVKQYKKLVLGNMTKQDSDDVTITGGSVTGATSAGKVQEISATGAISLDANHVKVTGPSSGTYAITLAAPSRGGQVMVIECVAMTGTSVTLALTNIVGGTAAGTATFDAANETLVLVSDASQWIVLAEQGVTLTS